MGIRRRSILRRTFLESTAEVSIPSPVQFGSWLLDFCNRVSVGSAWQTWTESTWGQGCTTYGMFIDGVLLSDRGFLSPVISPFSRQSRRGRHGCKARYVGCPDGAPVLGRVTRTVRGSCEDS